MSTSLCTFSFNSLRCFVHFAGEVPSKLETLTSVAVELAASAVHNGRFHHATASLALEEQLATTRKAADQRQLKFNSPFNKSRTAIRNGSLIRSASSSVFSQALSSGGESAFTDELCRASSTFSSGNLSSPPHSRANSMNTNPPEVVQSSQSDDNSFDSNSCSYASGPDDVEAGEWAADMIAIADQNMDVKENGRRKLSISESSSSSSGDMSSKSSGSPVGFWTVRPGSSIEDESEDDDDDDSICCASSLSHNPITSLKDKNLLSPHAFSSSNLGNFLKETKTGSSEEDSNNADDELGSLTPPSTTKVTSFSAFKPHQKTIMRSHSYAAFSSYPSIDCERRPTLLGSSTRAHSLSSTQENDLFRTYFMKFVDLLIVRETERLIHHSQRADE